MAEHWRMLEYFISRSSGGVIFTMMKVNTKGRFNIKENVQQLYGNFNVCKVITNPSPANLIREAQYQTNHRSRFSSLSGEILRDFSFADDKCGIKCSDMFTLQNFDVSAFRRAFGLSLNILS